MYCALGHGITDVDTGDIVNIASGELVETKIVSITKGEKGKPDPRDHKRNRRE